MKIIGIDIGTTSICGIVFDVCSLQIVSMVHKENHYIPGTREYDAQEDPNFIFDVVEDMVSSFVAEFGNDLSAISISTQMHGILYVDACGNAVSPLYTWENKAGVGREEEISRILGYPVYTGYGVVTHLMISVPDKARKFCSIGDYVVMKLAGNKEPITDISIAASLGIINPETMSITDKIDSAFFPDVVCKTEKVGEYQGIPVVTALGDNQASFIGSVSDLDGSLLLNYGTGGQISYFSKEKLELPGFERRPLSSEGFMYVAFSLAGGKAYSILKDFFQKVIISFGFEPPENMYEIMDSFIAKPSNPSIVCKPLFLGLRAGNNEFASFYDITNSNFSPENITESVVRGMAQELFEYYTKIPRYYKVRFNKIICAGNGIRKNKRLQNFITEKYQMPICFSRYEEESAVGAVMNALVGIGYVSSYKEIISKFNSVEIM